MTSTSTFDTFVFDLDGTLLDTLPDLVEVTNTTLREFGYPTHSTEEIHSFIGNGAPTLIRQAVPQDIPEEQAARVLARWKELYPQIGTRLTTIYPNLDEAVDVLKRRGAKLAVLSNKYEGGVKDVIPQFLPGLFDVMHGECEGIPRKPDPTGLLRTIRELGSTPERTAYVGDSPTDTAVARNAGTFAIGVAWGYHTGDELRAAGADAVLDNPLELLQFMAK